MADAARNRAHAMSAPSSPEHHIVSRLQIWWAVAVAITVVCASSRSTVAGPNVVNIDKVAHFAVYGLIATLICRVGGGWRGALWGLLGASAFGVTDEWHQAYVPGRSSDVFDWIADTTGAALAVSLYAGWNSYRRLLETHLWHWPGRRRVA